MALLATRKGWAVEVFIVCLNCKISVRLYPEFNKFMNNHPVLYWGVRSLIDVEEMVTATYGLYGASELSPRSSDGCIACLDFEGIQGEGNG